MSPSSTEARLAERPDSPVFARVAAEYLRKGQIDRAVELCEHGVRVHPRYATGHLILGQCYEAQGRNVEAMLEYRRALKAFPDNPAVQRLLRNVEHREQEAFKAFAEERARRLQGQKDTVTIEGYVSDDGAPKESTVEFLLKRLQEAKRTPPVRAAEEHATSEVAQPPGSGSKIVTATLAEIYANQGEYAEAIEAYRKLLDQRPLEADRFQRRIQELKELQKRQVTEAKR